MSVEHLVNVGIADIKFSSDQNIVFRTILGSCVGICLFDKKKNIGGMSHIMLPTYRKDKKSNFMKYADAAIPYLIEKIEKLGAEKKNTCAKITGGASMFHVSKTSFMRVPALVVSAANTKDFNKTNSRFNQPTSQQATLPKNSSAVFIA